MTWTAMGDGFFTVSKIVWGLIQPDTVLFILITISAFALILGKNRLAKYLIIFVFIGLGGIGVYPIGDIFLAPLERVRLQTNTFPPSHIIILGGGEDPFPSMQAGSPNLNEAGERILFGLAAARQYPESKIVLSGGSGNILNQSFSGALITLPILTEFDIAQDRIIIEDRSRNTFENAANIANKIQQNPDRSIILVTSAYHMPRSVGVFCRAGIKNIIPRRVDYRTSFTPDWDLSGHLFDLEHGIREWVGLIAYRIFDKTDTLIPSGC